ncbi:MAG TPA: ATP-binding protein, partial [Planctomycetaceae bacterium]|nr:ATP-binding protein [Planctomycetaceae bacterium]
LMMGPLEDALADAEGLSASNRDRLELARRNSLRLLKLVNTLLDFSRIEAGRMQASYEPTDLATLTTDLASNFRSTVERAGMRLVIDCPPLPELVYVDREMWEKIVLNLISNAFKFTLAGEIEVSLQPIGDGVRLTVRDTGTGIPGDEIPHLFQRFNRVKGARGRSYEGSGIGLALVQELARLHGGHVEVESELGHGSRFSVTVPLGKAHLPADRIEAERTLASTHLRAEGVLQEASRWLLDAPGEIEPKADNRPLTPATAIVADKLGNGRPTRHRILVADDNADMREYVQRLLEGYDVTAVADGQAALSAARKQPPDLVLTDVMMPGLDGFGLLRELRADPRTQDVPVILLSARAGEESRIAGMQAGADDYLAKPFSARDLLARVQAHLHLGVLRRESLVALRASESRYRAIVEATPECVKLVAPDGTILQMNSAGLAMVEGDESVLGQCVYNVIAPEFRDAYRAFNQAVCRGERGTLEFDIIGLRGTRRHMETKAVPLPAPSGGFTQLAVTRDVTDQQRTESELRDIRSRMEAALAGAAIGTWTWDVREDRFFADASLAKIFSLSQELAQGGPLSQIVDSIHPHDRERVAALVNRAVESGQYYEADYRVAQTDGTYRWITARGQVERDADGRAIRFPGVVIDITERKRAEEELARVTAESERRKRLYETILSATPDFVYVFSLDYRILYANDALVAMWGVGDPGGKTFLEIGYEPWHAEMHCREIDQVRATKAAIRGEVPFSGTNGRKIYDYIFVPVFGPDGEVEAVAGTTRDVTERKGMEEELRDADRRKDDFIALLAHELRNPLAPIRNGLQVLRLADRDPATLADARQMMERQLTHMVRLIDDLLDVSRINRNKMELRRSRVALADVITSAVETAQPQIDYAEHELSLTLPSAPVYLDADLTRLAQVFSNLLTNSAKYTPRGGRIGLSAKRHGAQVEVSVQDNGIGIPSASLEAIFDMFSQVDRTVERNTGGLGIGLALVKGLVEMHGGTVTAMSEGEGQGSTFTVTLPVLVEQSEPALPADAAPVRAPGRRILVVDDNKDGADSLAMMLRLMRNEVQTANDGVQALEQAERFRPEVVLMDIGMPKLNGLEATRRIREQPWGRDMRIIALTGWGHEGDRERSAEAGCDGHLVKPVDFSELEKLLSEVGRNSKPHSRT